jgi:protein-disulfide isomerase
MHDLPLSSRRAYLKAAAALAVAVAYSPSSRGQDAAVSPLLLMRFHAPNLGASDAKVNLVEFLDPACEGCRAFYPVVKQILAEHKGRVRLWVRYVAFHRGVDFTVKALEAARLQNRYWEALDTVFAKQDQWTRNHAAIPDLVLKSLDGIGLDLARLQKDMQNPDIERVLKQDMADAKALKVVQTPTFFVNGKPLREHGFEPLRTLVREEVRAQYR